MIFRSLVQGFMVLVLITLCASASLAQANFECQGLGAFPALSGPPDCNGVTALGSDPQTGVVAGNPCGFPTSGVQNAEVFAFGPLGTTPPPGGPAIAWPPTGGFEEVRILLPAGAPGISFNWDFYNSEAANFGACPQFNDGMEIALVDAGGNRLATLVYADAFTPSAPGLCVHPAGTAGGSAPIESLADGPEFFQGTFASPANSGDYISIVVWNGGDNAFQSIAAIDNVLILAGTPDYETNTPSASLDIDGVLATPSVPAVINKLVINCPGGSIPATGTLNFSSLNNPGGTWDIILSSPSGPFSSNLVPASSGGIVFANNEILNLSLGSSLASSNGPGVINLVSLPGAGVPGFGGGGFSAGLSIGTAADFSLQAVVTNAAALQGFELSQATEVHTTVGAAITLPGPTMDNEIVMVDVTAPPACFTSVGVNLYGTLFTTIFIDSNGRVMMGSANSDPTPTLLEFQNGPPSIALWNDFTPGGGSISISSPAFESVRVAFQNVAYLGIGGLNSFSITMDALNLQIDISGLSGVLMNPPQDMIVGMTPGGAAGATDPGIAPFAVGGTGGVLAQTEMLYDLGTLALPNSLVPGTLNTITFFDDTLGNYVWLGS